MLCVDVVAECDRYVSVRWPSVRSSATPIVYSPPVRAVDMPVVEANQTAVLLSQTNPAPVRVLLGPYPRYTSLRITATSTNAAGESGGSEPLLVITLPTAPSAVRGLRLEPAWTDPITLVRS